MNDTDILQMILSNLKTCDKHILIRDSKHNIVFPKDLDSIREIETLTSSMKNKKEFKANGNNYIIKCNTFNYNDEIFTFSIIENINKLKKMQEKAKYDTPTKLLNKETILSTIDNYLLNQNHNLNEIAVVVCDVDSFKNINDTYGHPVGDKVLENVAGIFIEYENKYNNFVTGRFGGDEFVFVFKNTSSGEVFNIINKIKSRIENEAIQDKNRLIKITMSFGIYAIDGFSPIEFSSLTDIINKRQDIFSAADKALYDSKEHGKNKITMIVDQEKKFRVL